MPVYVVPLPVFSPVNLLSEVTDYLIVQYFQQCKLAEDASTFSAEPRE